MSWTKKTALLTALVCVFACSGWLYFGVTKTRRAVTKSPIDRSALVTLDKGVRRTMLQEVALIRATGPLSADLTRRVVTPPDYESSIHKFLEGAVTFPTEKDQDNAREIVAGLVRSLRMKRVSSKVQSQILTRMGQYFYHQALFGQFEGYPPELKIRLLRLAIEHLNQSKRSTT